MTRVVDPVTNFAEVIPLGTYSAVDTAITLTTGTGGTLPDTSDGAFNLVWFNSTDYTGPSADPQKEIVRVVTRTVDILTVLRGQEGTTASTKQIAGKVYKMALTVTKRIIDEINTQLELDKTLTDAIGVAGFPTQTGNTGKYLTTDGTALSWGTGGSGVSTVTNNGTGTGTVGMNVTGSVLNLKTIKAGTNVTITNNANDITINATGGGGGGDVFLASNNAFTGNNTHAGSETFTGTVDLSGATITYPSGTATGGSNTFNTGTTQTYTTGSSILHNTGNTETHDASSTDTYSNESIILNQADETFGVGYEGAYDAASVVVYNNRPTFNGGLTVPTGTDITITDTPVDGTDAVNKTYVDTAVANAGGGVSDTAYSGYDDFVQAYNISGNTWVTPTGVYTVTGSMTFNNQQISGATGVVYCGDNSGSSFQLTQDTTAMTTAGTFRVGTYIEAKMKFLTSAAFSGNNWFGFKNSGGQFIGLTLTTANVFNTIRLNDNTGVVGGNITVPTPGFFKIKILVSAANTIQVYVDDVLIITQAVTLAATTYSPYIGFPGGGGGAGTQICDWVKYYIPRS